MSIVTLVGNMINKNDFQVNLLLAFKIYYLETNFDLIT